MNETNQLLLQYAENGSETAFRELVERYVDLVYSVAVRRSNGDSHRAEDIVQTVFTDLARKAHDLAPTLQLGGWLHKHCCFVASTLHRSEARRQARERQAMDLLNDSAGADEARWEDLAPALDEAIQELQETDRDAIVLRFFEKRDLRSVGQALGTSEDAAQKRVSRAVDKLRQLLLQRGLALSVTGLTGYLASQSVCAAPFGWVPRVVSFALKRAGSTAGKAAATGAFALLLGSSAFKLGALLTAVAFFAGAILWNREDRKPNDRVAAPPLVSGTVPSEHDTTPATAYLNASLTAQSPSIHSEDTNVLKLHLIARESALPVGDSQVEFFSADGQRYDRRTLTTDSEGRCAIPIQREKLTELELTTRIDGFADTRVKWWPPRGDTIPYEYTVKLDRGVPLGGRVVDVAGNPVAGAKVSFGHRANPDEANLSLSHNFGWIEIETDEHGGWRLNRIANELIRRLEVGANHPEFVSSYISVPTDPTTESSLRAGTHVFTLAQGATVRGIVIEESGLPIPGAKVLVGELGNVDSREGVTELDGSFEIKGCKPGKTMITAQADQYAPAELSVNISRENSESYKIVLASGKLLKIRVVNRVGHPITNAYASLNTRESTPDGERLTVQAGFTGKTDSDGRITWNEAPDRDLSFGIGAPGHLPTALKVRPDGNEHGVTLLPGLKISGTVVDAESGKPIPKFKIIAGDPYTAAGTNARTLWSTIDRFWLTFTEGKFEHTWEEPVIMGRQPVEYIFKFEAEGYAAHVTRPVNAEEESVYFDVRMKSAKSSLITVRAPDGSAVPNADVVLARALQHVQLVGHSFSRDGINGIVHVTDVKGQLQISPEDDVVQIYAASSEGFAAMVPNELLKTGVLQLQPWGRLEGTFTKGRTGVSGKTIALDSLSRNPALPRLSFRPYAKTDPHGRFLFSRVPAGKFKVAHLVEDAAAPGSSIHMPFEAVEIRPGETSTIQYDESGSDVTLRVEWPADFPRDNNHQLTALIQTVLPAPPPGAIGNPGAMRAWRNSPGIEELAARARRYQLRETENGLLRAEQVQSGNYTVVISVSVSGADSAFGAPVLSARKELVVPQSTGELVDLGTIALTAAGAGGAAN